jgi:hypothetical protein
VLVFIRIQEKRAKYMHACEAAWLNVQITKSNEYLLEDARTAIQSENNGL